MWTLQSTSKHKGPRGHVFSPCLKWKGPIHHWMFVTETEATRSIRVFVHVCLKKQADMHPHTCSAYACLSTYTLSVICTCTGVRCTVEIRGHSNAFSASKYHDWNIYCLRTFDKSCFAAAFEPTENLTNARFQRACDPRAALTSCTKHKTIETETNVSSV